MANIKLKDPTTKKVIDWLCRFGIRLQRKSFSRRVK